MSRKPGAIQNYLITQAIAEYLALKCKPGFDGVIFSSAQRAEGRNIVLFSHAAVKPTSSIVATAGGFHLFGPKAADPLSLEYVPCSLILHSITDDTLNTLDVELEETASCTDAEN